ncbi:MAG: hypothetical protein DHS20C17_21870 [Cyclobacteriaceae bacterium]|nr:MAG: hypothetical protein DHS20C17_21870 [Cyclobacteriaceae bacterium]
MTNVKTILFSLLLICFTTAAMAQFASKKDGKKPRKEGSKFSLFNGGNKNKSNTKTEFKGDAPQWQLGIKGGVNLSHVEATKSYTVVTPLDLSSNLTNAKTYDKAYSNIGNHVGLTGAVALSPNISLGFEPGYTTYKFGYENTYEWSQFEDVQSYVHVANDVDHVISYLDFPLSLKYHLKTGPLKPYLQIGGYYGFRTNADKTINTTIEDGAGGGLDELSSTTQRTGVDELFLRSSAGILGGAGLSLDVGSSPSSMSGGTDLGTVRFVLGVNYRYGLHNIVDVKTRYNDTHITSGSYDVTDDLELRNIEIYLGCQFTLKYKSY